jgi:hypothetical protein
MEEIPDEEKTNIYSAGLSRLKHTNERGGRALGKCLENTNFSVARWDGEQQTDVYRRRDWQFTLPVSHSWAAFHIITIASLALFTRGAPADSGRHGCCGIEPPCWSLSEESY